MAETGPSRVYRFADITIETATLEVLRGSTALALEPKAFRLLLYLLENRDRVVAKEELIARVWDGAFVGDNALTRVVAQLRKQLGDSARSPRYIQTAATTGYRFIAEVITGEAPSNGVPGQPIAGPAPSPSLSRRRARGWMRIAAGVALVSAAGLWAAFRLNPRNDRSPRLGTLRQITSSGATDVDPTFSPDGSQIAFVSNRTGHFELFIGAIAPGGLARQITSDGEDKLCPAWSPDGKFVAFALEDRGGIAVIPSSGGVIRYLTDFGTQPAWSPDGGRLVFSSGNAGRAGTAYGGGGEGDVLWVANLDGSPPRQLTRRDDPPGGHHSPHSAPDGRHVGFAASVERRRRLWVVDTKSGQTRPIHLPVENAVLPVFSPDGQSLYCIGYKEVSSGGVWRASTPSGIPQHPSWYCMWRP